VKKAETVSGGQDPPDPGTLRNVGGNREKRHPLFGKDADPGSGGLKNCRTQDARLEEKFRKILTERAKKGDA